MHFTLVGVQKDGACLGPHCWEELHMFLYGCERVRNKAVMSMFDEANHLPNASADFLTVGELGL